MMQKIENDWNPGIWVLIWEYSVRAIQWIQTWQSQDGFQKYLCYCALNNGVFGLNHVFSENYSIIWEMKMRVDIGMKNKTIIRLKSKSSTPECNEPIDTSQFNANTV